MTPFFCPIALLPQCPFAPYPISTGTISFVCLITPLPIHPITLMAFHQFSALPICPFAPTPYQSHPLCPSDKCCDHPINRTPSALLTSAAITLSTAPSMPFWQALPSVTLSVSWLFTYFTKQRTKKFRLHCLQSPISKSILEITWYENKKNTSQ